MSPKSLHKDGWIQPATKPNAVQSAMLKRRYGMFIHYGINTFIGEEWTDGTHPPETFAPKGIDTDDWAATAAEAGMTYVILTVKHHEGFCLWPTEWTRHCAREIDVVARLAESCRKYGIELGLYYSLWDRNWEGGIMRQPYPTGPKVNLGLLETPYLALDEAASRRYVDFMKAQLAELLSNYGPVCELWLDGGWTQPRSFWKMPEVYALVKSLQPCCAIGVNWSIGYPKLPDVNWPDRPLDLLVDTRCDEIFVGVKPADQRGGFPIRYFPCDFRLGDPFLPVEPDPKTFSHDGETYYLPYESTVCLNQRWFSHPEDTALKSVEELAELYKRATVQDNILILNSPPNRDGIMPPYNRLRLAELRLHLADQDRI